MTKQLKAEMLLLLVVTFWGISYYLMDISLQELEPFTLNAFRFLGAFAAAVILAFPKLKSVNRTTIKYSFYIGVALIFVYIGANIWRHVYQPLQCRISLCPHRYIYTDFRLYF